MKNLLLYISLIFSIFVYSQKYNFIEYSVESGFPQSNADHIFQDDNGYMWFATQNGVVRFDGIYFETINEKKGLVSSLVQGIYQDSEGRIYFSTKKGLSIFHAGKFQSVTKDDGLQGEDVVSVLEREKGEILICTRKGPSIYKDGKLSPISPELNVSKFIKRRNGDIIAATSKGLYLLHDSILVEVKDQPDELKRLITDVVEENDSVLWISTRIGLYRYASGRYRKYTVSDGLIHEKITALLMDSRGAIWYGSENSGCGYLYKGEFKNFTTENGLTSKSVLSLFEDREKNIWVGTRNGPCMLSVRSPFIHYDKVSENDDEIILGVSGDHNKNVWFCSYGYGLVKYDGEKYYTINTENGLIENYVFDVEVDGDVLWIASANNGIIRYENGRSIKIDKVGSLSLDRIYTIFKDSKGNIWFGGNSGGVVKYDGTELIPYGKKDGFTANGIMGFAEDDDGSIWMASTTTGVYKFDGRDFYNYGVDQGLSTSYVRCITNVKGELWFGSASDGIFKITEENGEFNYVYLTEEDGLSSNNIYLLYYDSRGILWCGTDRGIDRIVFTNGEISEIKNYNREEGFFGVETNINGVYEDIEGNIWFGTVGGSTKYLRNIDGENDIEPKTYINGLKLFFDAFNFEKYSEGYDALGLPKNLMLDYDKNHLTIEFIGLCFSNPEKVQYKYRLLGQSDSWSPPTKDRKAVFTNIAPGDYEFQVIACNNDGVWNKEPVVFKFSIDSPYWQKTWFIVSMIILISLIVLLVVNWRIRSLKRSKKVLEQKVADRTQEIIHQKEEIETQRNHTEEQKKIIEKIHREVEQSIVYATRIQHSVFPEDEIMIKYLDDHFVFFRARDKVSGDFYWWTHIENHTVVTAADCTGHGVPGAFMSMLGISFLREIVQKEYITHPGVILRKMRKEVIKALKQTNEIGTHRDGMDMALISIDHENNKLQFAGANNPLYLIRKTNDLRLNELGEFDTPPLVMKSPQNGYSLIQIKGDKMPISIFYRMERFVTHDINLQKGDMLYLFSDGFADQFGGSNAGKFKFKNFRKVLLDNAHLSMMEQREGLVKTFNDWKGDLDQVDDVVVLGMRI